MNKAILLIDDEKEFKDSFMKSAQSNGFNLAWGKSYEDLTKKLPKISTKITSIVLDIKCLIKNDQEIEKPDFIGSALNYLGKNYPEIPRLILTGDEGALEGIKMFFNTETEDIYTKSPDDIKRLFEKIHQHHENFDNRKLETNQKLVLGLLEKDESKTLEFKSSMRYCVKENRKDRKLEFVIVKTLASFLNSEGGVLLIGVNDEKAILGLEQTDFTTFNKPDKSDSFKIQLDNLIQNNFGDATQRLITADMVVLEGKTICKIEVFGKHVEPIYVKRKVDNGSSYNAFYIRGQASVKELKGEEIDKYIAGNWNK